jgi:hypothetical protein
MDRTSRVARELRKMLARNEVEPELVQEMELIADGLESGAVTLIQLYVRSEGVKEVIRECFRRVGL